MAQHGPQPVAQPDEAAVLPLAEVIVEQVDADEFPSSREMHCGQRSPSVIALADQEDIVLAGLSFRQRLNGDEFERVSQRL